MTGPETAPTEAAPRPQVVRTCAAALLATGAFGWLAGSAFEGVVPVLTALGGAALGVGAVALSTRSRRPALVQYAGAAVGLGVALLLLSGELRSGASPLSLVRSAVQEGGLGEPPVPFAPGWRFLLFLGCTVAGEAIAALALAWRRPRLAPALATPVVIGAALLQPPEADLAPTVVAVLLLAAALAVSFGGDVPGADAGAGFEVRRLLRGAVALALLAAAVGGVAQVGALFPPAAAEDVVPPQRPQALPPPADPDRELFRVTADRPLAWRLGTLDVYRDPAWLTPPYDPARLQTISGAIPEPVAGADRTVTARFTVTDLAGAVLPSLANPVRVSTAVDYDPRTQVLRSPSRRASPGATYDVVAAEPPTGRALAVSDPPRAAVREFLAAPPMPAEVTTLLEQAPEEGAFARLQAVRTAYYSKVVAAGRGDPVDVSPARVAELLRGRPATPYEITAAEVLLARWTGVPARIGYGYVGGERTSDPRVRSIRSKHGATWLEAWFEGAGWVPILGTPPRAKASLNSGDRNADPSVRAADELALVVYVPVRLSSARQAYRVARYYAVRIAPLLVLGGLLLALVPALARVWRGHRRRRFAARGGPPARLAAAYAGFRDALTDLGVATPVPTPIELVEVLAPDPEHTELAWLVTRGLWGDLARDLQPADAEAAERMARSLTRRARSAQPGATRLAALLSRASLREPWSRELPGAWWSPRGRTRGRWAPSPAVIAAGLVLAVAMSTAVVVARDPGSAREAAKAENLAAALTLGDIQLQRERAAEQAFRRAPSSSLAAEGRVFSIRQGATVQGSVQVATLLPDVDVRSRRVRDAVLQSLGAGQFRPIRLGEQRAFRLARREQTLLLAFAPDGRSYTLLATRRGFADGERVLAAVLSQARGSRDTDLLRQGDVPVPDPRRGIPS